ncbi:hypothetical protein B0H17DRAFT_946944 [Mycena rosella]|uniref:HAT C-terminal dimerisation domain-containing protein n=1 Tax=Mycena rosella TaxID=1033263 RepID=A0AAD7GAY7_MYCRO|nr:hypothetical protein B0H17DRAFT_946944 [Mycena rosella]
MITFWLDGRYVTASSSALFSDLLPQLHAIHFPILSHIARVILCIPDVSIVVGCLFSSSMHTMSDAWLSMAASTALLTVVVKELLNAGFRDGLDYLEGVTIH